MGDIIDLKDKETERVKSVLNIEEHEKLEKKFLAKYGTREHAINRMIDNYNTMMIEIGVLRSLLWTEYEKATSTEEVFENEDFRLMVGSQDDMNKSMTDILHRFENIIKELDSK